MEKQTKDYERVLTQQQTQHIDNLTKGFEALKEQKRITHRLNDTSDITDYIIMQKKEEVREVIAGIDQLSDYIKDTLKTVMPSGFIPNGGISFKRVINRDIEDASASSIRGIPSVKDGSIDVKFECRDGININSNILGSPLNIATIHVKTDNFFDYKERMMDLAIVGNIFAGYRG